MPLWTRTDTRARGLGRIPCQPHTKQCLLTMAGVGATMGIHLGDMAGALLFMKGSLNLSFQEQELVMGALYLSTGLAALCLG